jgi:hypothetical protein
MHCMDNAMRPSDELDPLYDKVGLVRWVMEGFVSKAQSLFNAEKYLTADEIIVAYRGHYSSIRQYNPMKPTKYGIKVWALVSNPSRYIYNLTPYVGKFGSKPEAGLGSSVVLQLVHSLHHRGHTVVTDNFFTSPSLFERLLRRGIWATGTTKDNSIRFPTELRRYKNGQYKRGSFIWRMHRSRTMAATFWFDR